jgi:protein TonB
VRISQGVTKGLLIQKIEPAYPPLARAARVQGEVVLSALIDSNGQITNLQLISGHPMLVPAAISAVKQWRYKPYLLNGQPVEVETTITVIFSLQS